MYKLTRDELCDFKRASETEVYLPNGLGGYLAITAGNCLFKKHNAYLTNSINPPTERYILLSKIIERLEIEGREYSFDCQEFSDGSRVEGNRYLGEFIYDLVPSYVYELQGVKIIKTLAPAYGSNGVGITYLIENNSGCRARLNLTPLFTSKVFGEAATTMPEVCLESRGQIVLDDGENKCYFRYSEGNKAKRKEVNYENIKYQFDYDTGDKRSDSAYTPIDICIDLKPDEFKLVEITATADGSRLHAKNIIHNYKKRCKMIMRDSFLNDQFGERLALSCDSFISYRKSTDKKTILAGLPWFTDWGRDTMISFTGALLVTKRFSEAREVLLSFKDYLRDGLIPNMFPTDGCEPIYNTADASLWYFIAAYNYYRYTNDPEFIRDNLLDTLVEIYRAYKNGTKFNIHMDTDKLIIAGSDLDQVTWMDVRVNDVVVTPRHGKPVEINALWYNAIKILEFFFTIKGDDASEYTKLSLEVEKSFNEKFFNSSLGCLYDVVDPNDSSIRPNQLFAISLPFKLIPMDKAKRVVEVVREHLFTKLGIRSLSIYDERFKPKYEGNLWSRDMAYHMGTVWPWLMGAYLDAYLYVNYYSKEAIAEAKGILLSINSHMHEYCLNGIAEIFDGENPGVSRGCSNQAWSVAEILRAYFENLICKNIRVRIDK